MNIVDSSCWLEYLSGSATGDVVAPLIEETNKLVVPVITIYEVFKKLLTEAGEEQALKVAAHMKLGRVIDVNLTVSLEAAKFSKLHKLPMADALIYATARLENCTLWTQDAHFEALEGVRFLPKKNQRN